MERKKGFTLIELLAVLALLALIMIVIVAPMVTKVQKVKQDLSDSQKKLIYSAAETYIKKNQDRYPKKEGEKYCISLQTLVYEGLLQDNIINQLSEEEIPLERTIQITVESRVNYAFEFDANQTICKEY